MKDRKSPEPQKNFGHMETVAHGEPVTVTLGDLPPFGSTGAFRIGGNSIRYFDTSPEGIGIPLLFVHGYSGSGYEARCLARYLCPEFRIVAPDLPGMGFSDKPAGGYSLRLFVETIRGLTARLELESFHLVGHSMGGATAIAYASAFPDTVRDLILLAPFGLEGEQGSMLKLLTGIYPLVNLAMNIVNRKLYRTVLETMVFHDADRIPPELEEYLAESLLARGGNETLGAITRDVMNVVTIDDLLPELRRFVLLIWGTEDRVLSYEWSSRFTELLPLSKLVPVPECGHMPHVEFPELTAREIVSFIRRRSIL